MSDYETLESLPFVISTSENKNFSLYFTGNVKAKIFIDNAKPDDVDKDFSKSSNHINKDNNSFFTPDSITTPLEQCHPFYVYYNDGSYVKNGYGPGIYRIKVDEPDMTPLYAYFRVTPKFLTDQELRIMRDELESTTYGLARSFEAINNGILSTKVHNLETKMLEKLEILHRSERQFRIATYNVINNPRVNLNKRYGWKTESNGNIDEHTTRVMETIPNVEGRIFSFERYIQYNNLDNRVIKYELNALNRIVSRLIQNLTSEIQTIETYSSQSLNSLKSEKKMLFRYKSTISKALTSTFFKDIQSINGSLSYSAMMNTDYKSIDLIFKSVEKNSNNHDYLVRQYVYDWLRTQDLYEIWGFTHTVKVLLDMELVPVSGWIFDEGFKEDYLLKHGTHVNLIKNNDKGEPILKIQIKYNVALSRFPKNDELLWTTSNHNKPDIILTVQDMEDTLLIALVMDTKYRNLSRIYGGNKEQLLGYLDGIKSEKYLNSPSYKRLAQATRINKKSPVGSTAILFPKIMKQDEYLKNYNNIQPIELRPGMGDDNLIKFIDEALKSGITLEESYHGNL